MDLLAQVTTSSTEVSTVSSPLGVIIGLIFVVLVFAGMWKTFAKAGYPGWAAIVPIYNAYILLKIAGKPGWWLLLFLIPVVNVIVQVLVALEVAKTFGKSSVFGIIGLFLFSPIGYLMLGFGDATYGSAQPQQSFAAQV